MAAARGLGEQVFVHAFMDGRDTRPRAALLSWRSWSGPWRAPAASVATSGRYRAMDRDKAGTAGRTSNLVHGEGATASCDPVELVRAVA